MTRFNLGKPYEKFIQDQIDAGLYSNATEVVRDALRRMSDERERKRVAHIHKLIAAAEEQVARGETKKFTRELMSDITQQALENSKAGKPIKAEVLG